MLSSLPWPQCKKPPRKSSAHLYILIPPSPLFAAHWSLFIPELLPYDNITKRHEESNIGRRIHVSGDRLNGFHLEIIRNYNIGKHRTLGNRRYLAALIPAERLVTSTSTPQAGPADVLKDEDEGGGFVDNVPIDAVENICVEVEAPGPSLNSSQTAVLPGGKRIKTEVKDCQWWVREVIKKLSDRGLLEKLPMKNMMGMNDALEIIHGLPKH